MFKTEKIEPNYSFIMAPFYLVDNDNLLRNQLLNLNNQSIKCFEVIIPDPHHSKRSWMKDFVERLDFNVIHFPYIPNLKIPKSFDYCIYNNAVLMSNTDKIIIFSDWRFCHHDLIKILLNYQDKDFVGFLWQILYKDHEPIIAREGGGLTPHSKSTINIDIEQAKYMYNTGLFPCIDFETHLVDTFHNSSWGHYCIDKNLWMDVNGIDEVVTNTRHYADLDLNTRLQEYYNKNKKQISIHMLKNVMTRIMHNRGQYFGFSNIELDFKINDIHKNCCFADYQKMNDKQFVEYVVKKIQNQEYKKLYETPYCKNFVNENNNDSLDKKYATIGFICTKCNLIGETPHWYEKSPNARIRSMIGVGSEENLLGRNLKKIEIEIQNKNFDEKISVLNNSWYIKDFYFE